MATIRERMERLVEAKNPYAPKKPLPFKKLKSELLSAVDALEAAEQQADKAHGQIHDLAYAKASALEDRGVTFYSDSESPDSNALRALVSLYRAEDDKPSVDEMRRYIRSLPDED